MQEELQKRELIFSKMPDEHVNRTCQITARRIIKDLILYNYNRHKTIMNPSFKAASKDLLCH